MQINEPCFASVSPECVDRCSLALIRSCGNEEQCRAHRNGSDAQCCELGLAGQRELPGE
jgi:hypothetical protein